MTSQRARFRSLYHPWLLPVPTIPEDGVPTHIRGYSMAESIEMFYRRDNWTAGFRWLQPLKSSNETINGKAPRGSLNGSRAYTLTDIKATVPRPVFISDLRPPEPHIPYYTGFRTRPGGSYELSYNGPATTLSVVTSHLYNGAVTELAGSGFYHLGANGSNQYAAAVGTNRPWMSRAGNLYYPEVGILGYMDITCATSPWHGVGPQWPEWPGGEVVDWPAIATYDWPRIRIIFSNRELGFGDSYNDEDGTFARRGTCLGTSVIDGQSSTAYATIFEGDYLGAGAAQLGFAKLELPEEGAEHQFRIEAGWADPDSGRPTWYKYAGSGGPLYNEFTGEVVLLDPDGHPYTPLTAPFP